MTKDGIIQDVDAKTRRLMEEDFNKKQAEALFGFVHEQIKDYCHSKVEQRIFENKIFENLHSKDDQKIFEENINERFDLLKSENDMRFSIIESKLDELSNAIMVLTQAMIKR